MYRYNKFILHIPHSSMHIPIEAMEQYTNTEELHQTLNELTDIYTDEIFRMDVECFTEVIFPYSRTYCDVERFLDDDKEHMAKKGMGVLYSKGVNGIEFRKFNQGERKRVEFLYNQHHQKVKDLIQKELLIGEKPLLIDCHSFSNKRYKNDGLNSDELPDFCIGFNENSTYPLSAVNFLKEKLEELGFSVLLNTPFAGSLYYDEYDHHSLMIEINKKLYVENDHITKSGDFNKIKSLLSGILIKLKAIN